MAVRAEFIGERTEVDLDRDRALVLRYQDGDEAAFDELYTRYYPRLHLYCRRRVGDSFVAEELAQEAFLRALRAMPRFAGERRFYPWMTVIAQRLCIDHHRSAARVEPAAEIDTGSVEADPGDVFTAVDRGYLEAALDRVAPRHREVLHLREQEGWSYQQIAEHLAVPVTTIEALLHRARKSLRREFLAVGGGRLSSIPVLAGLTAWVGRLRARVGGSGESSAHTGFQAATAGLAAVSLAVAPLLLDRGSDPKAHTATNAPEVTTHAPATSAALSPSDPVVVASAPAAAATVAPSADSPAVAEAPVGTDLGVGTLYTTPDGADYAGDQAEAMPVHVVAAPDVRVGADPQKLLTQLLSILGGPS